MFSSEKMTKVRVIGVNSKRDKIVEYLHKAGNLHITKGTTDIQDAAADGYESKISGLLVKVSGAIKLLDPMPIEEERHIHRDKLIGEIEEFAKLDEMFSLADRKREINEELLALENAERTANYFAGMDINFSALESGVLEFKEYIMANSDVQKFDSMLAKSKIKYELITKEMNKKSSLALVAYEQGSSIADIASKFNTTEIDIRAKYIEGTPADVEKHVVAKRKELNKELADINESLHELSKLYYSKLIGYKEMLEIELQRAGVSAQFKQTEQSFVIEGWVATDTFEKFKTGLDASAGGLVHVEKVKSEELAPTLIRKSKLLEPFYFLVEFFSLPRSDEIDPTMIFILSFPIFYGLMVSDAGYGVLSFVIATLLAKRSKKDGLLYNVAKIWQVNAIAVVVFGILSNQYFGFEFNQNFTSAKPLDWTTGVNSIVVLTVAFGLLQVCLGLLLGFVNNYNKGHKKVAYGKLTSIILILAGTVAVAGGLFGAVSANTTNVAAIIAIVALVLTIALSGREAVELTNLITHPLSYTRILGFGFASIIIAKLIDMAFTPTLNNGIIPFVLFTLLFILLHTLNMMLSIFEGIVQGVRLNFIEFFSKFYSGNGKKFSPFSYKRVHTKE